MIPNGISRHPNEKKIQKLRTMCRMCLNRCGMIATVEDGVVTRLDGDEDNPYSK